MANLTSTITAYVTEKINSIFARHGVPETGITDSGPQVSAAEFAACDYDFTHMTSSLCYPQSNGEAVIMVKSLLKKGEDQHKALIAYRATAHYLYSC